MCWPLVLSSVLATGVGAFNFAPAPLRFWALPLRNYVVTPNGVLNIASVRDIALPAKLTISDQSDMKSPDQVPYFKVNPDSTIAWDGTDLCIEAGDGDDNMVQINRCTGGSAQMWKLLPLDAEQPIHQIQLKGTNRCIDVQVRKKEDAWNGVAMELQKCERKVTEQWKFEEVIPFPIKGPSQRSFSSLGHAMIPFLSIVLLGAATLSAWLWRWQKGTRMVTAGQRGMPVNMAQDGLCLTAPSKMRPNHAPLVVSLDANARWTVPAVMALGAEDYFEKLVSSHDVVFFDLEGCPFCRKAEKALTDRGIKFEKAQIGPYKDLLKRLTSKTSAPSVWVNGTYVGGCNDGIEPWHGVIPMLANGRFDAMLRGEPPPPQASAADDVTPFSTNDVYAATTTTDEDEDNLGPTYFSASGALSPGKVGQLTAAQLREEMEYGELPLVIDVFASWCGPCRMLAPMLDELAIKGGDQLRVAKLDSDAEPQLTDALGVDSFPTVFFMKDGRTMFKINGVPDDQEALDKVVAENLQVKLLTPEEMPPPVFSASGALFPGKVGQLTAAQLREEISYGRLPLVIDVFASWCAPCKQLAPMLDRFASNCGEQVRVAKLDSDAEPELVKEMKVDAFPTVIFLKNAQPVVQLQGAPEEGQMEKILAEYLQVEVSAPARGDAQQ